MRKIRIEINPVHLMVSLAIAAFLFFAIVTDFMGVVTRAELSYASFYVRGTNETVEVAQEIREACAEFNGDTHALPTCYRNQVFMSSSVTPVWLSTPPKPIQPPAETLEKQTGNCVDRAILAATLFRELDFKHVYLVLQNAHMCIMVADDTGLHHVNCIPQSPVLGTLRVYSSGF